MPQEKQTTAVSQLIESMGWNKDTLFCQKYLAIERQQIEDAYKQGNFDGIVLKDANSNEYFNRTFTQQQ